MECESFQMKNKQQINYFEAILRLLKFNRPICVVIVFLGHGNMFAIFAISFAKSYRIVISFLFGVAILIGIHLVVSMHASFITSDGDKIRIVKRLRHGFVSTVCSQCDMLWLCAENDRLSFA